MREYRRLDERDGERAPGLRRIYFPRARRRTVVKSISAMSLSERRDGSVFVICPPFAIRLIVDPKNRELRVNPESPDVPLLDLYAVA